MIEGHINEIRTVCVFHVLICNGHLFPSRRPVWCGYICVCARFTSSFHIDLIELPNMIELLNAIRRLEPFNVTWFLLVRRI